MKTSLARAIRRLVLAALTPLPVVSCATRVAVTSSGTATGSGGGRAGGSDSSATVGSSASSEGHGSSTVTGTGGTMTIAPCAAPGTGGSGGASTADGGPCSPFWLTGNANKGGKMCFPCGLPPAPVMMEQTPIELCSEYCMGSSTCTLCLVDGADGGPVGEAYLDTDAGGAPTVVTCGYLTEGRRPAGLVDEGRSDARSVGEVLARMAYLEAASVDAFRDLAAQLEAHGAPNALVKRLERARADEARHARDVGALARARGAEPPPVVVENAGARSLLALALENAREGCVRETWGAACAVAQGERARDPEVRETMRGIARDELRHVRLSWDIARWTEPRLTAADRALVTAERDRAVAELEREIENVMPEPWARALGLPSRMESRAILASMRSAVWSDRPVA